MKKIIYLFWLFLYLTTAKAQVFEPPVIIDPPNPMVGDTIMVGLFKNFHFPCLILPMENQDGETHLFDFDNSLPGFEKNHIDLIVVSMDTPICMPIPISPAPREYYELGTLEEGNYSLQIGWVGRFTTLPPPSNIIPFAYGDILIFSVTKPKIIDSTATYGLVSLFALILFLTLFLSVKKGIFY